MDTFPQCVHKANENQNSRRVIWTKQSIFLREESKMWARNTQAQEKPPLEVLGVLSGLEQLLSGLPLIEKQFWEKSNSSLFSCERHGKLKEIAILLFFFNIKEKLMGKIASNGKKYMLDTFKEHNTGLS